MDNDDLDGLRATGLNVVVINSVEDLENFFNQFDTEQNAEELAKLSPAAVSEPSDGDYARWAMCEGAVQPSDGKYCIAFASHAQWGRFCDRARAALSSPPSVGEPPSNCTCHPDDRPQECQKKFAASECIATDSAKPAGEHSNAKEYTAFLEREFGPSRGQTLPHFTIGNVSRAFGAGWVEALAAAPDSQATTADMHVCPRHDFDLVADPKAGCAKCNADSQGAPKPPTQAEIDAALDQIAEVFSEPLDSASQGAPKSLAEPVLCQMRMRANWSKNWSEWEKCSEAAASDYERATPLHDWHYEVRRLYLHPSDGAQAAGQEDVREALHMAYDALLDIQKMSGVIVAPSVLHRCYEALGGQGDAGSREETKNQK